MLYLNHYLKEEDEKRSSTEEYWDATEIARDGFNALLKFNFGEDGNGNKYIITIDNNDAERFNAGSDEEAISVYEKWKEERKSGLVDYDFENSYDKITESVKPKTLKEEILDDKTENDIISTIANIDELISTIEHTVEDDALTINSQIDAINEATTLNIERIYTTDLYSNLQSVKDDLEDAIKYSEMDKEEMNESVDDASFKKAVLDDFNEFIQDKYDISSVEDLVDQLEHITEEDVNDYCSSKFYDIGSDEDLDELNKGEEIIRKEYNVEPE